MIRFLVLAVFPKTNFPTHAFSDWICFARSWAHLHQANPPDEDPRIYSDTAMLPGVTDGEPTLQYRRRTSAHPTAESSL